MSSTKLLILMLLLFLSISDPTPTVHREQSMVLWTLKSWFTAQPYKPHADLTDWETRREGQGVTEIIAAWLDFYAADLKTSQGNIAVEPGNTDICME